jgi:hypothetical protein
MYREKHAVAIGACTHAFYYPPNKYPHPYTKLADRGYFSELKMIGST